MSKYNFKSLVLILLFIAVLFPVRRASALSVDRNFDLNSWQSGDGSCEEGGWGFTALTITYVARLYNDSTGGNEIPSGASVPGGTVLRVEPRLSNDGVNYYVTGGCSDSPFGYWYDGPMTDNFTTNLITVGSMDDGIAKIDELANGQIPTADSPSVGLYGAYVLNYNQDVIVKKPTISYSWSGGGCNGITGNSCTTTTAGTVTASVNFAATYAGQPWGMAYPGVSYVIVMGYFDSPIPSTTITFNVNVTGNACAANYNQACYPSNSCGQQSTGSIGCDGVTCSVSAPPDSDCPLPTSSVSVSPDPVPYGGNPGFTLTSTNAYYCYVTVDWASPYLVNGYTTSGTFYNGAFTSPGTHYVYSYCYNSVWSGSGWSTIRFTVTPPLTVTLTPFDPPSVTVGQSSRISFSEQNGNWGVVCSATGTADVDWGSLGQPNVSSVQGAYTRGNTVSTAGTYTQSITCTDSSGPATSSTQTLIVTPGPTASVSISQNPVPYGANPGFTLTSTNAYYCAVLVDGYYLLGSPGYFTSGTFFNGPFTTPGTHTANSYCYNSAWVWSGWSTTSFTVDPLPTASVSISQNPVPYGGNPGFTLTSTNAYYCYVRVDGVDLPGTPGYFTSGTYYHGAFTSSGTHTASAYCYNSVWSGSGWSNISFTVDQQLWLCRDGGIPFATQGDPPKYLELIEPGSVTFKTYLNNANNCSGSDVTDSTSFVDVPTGITNDGKALSDVTDLTSSPSPLRTVTATSKLNTSPPGRDIGIEKVEVTYNGNTIVVYVRVTENCASNCSATWNVHCSNEPDYTTQNSCVLDESCPGHRYCDFNYKEVVP